MKKLKVAMIGCGARGDGLYRADLRRREEIRFVGFCDVYEDRARALAEKSKADGQGEAGIYTDYKACIDTEKPDAVIVSASWEKHIEISLYAMRRGIAVGCEVAGAYTEEALWKLVDCYEETHTPIMMLENCCYGRLELLALNMKRMGLLGEIVHCECGYRHDLREEVADGIKNRHYRLEEYTHRNADNYPTHGIGPVAKLLDINTGNKFLTINSVASKSAGMKSFIERFRGDNPDLIGRDFRQADVVTSVIRCENGETVTMTLDTTLPRFYSRNFIVEGTKGMLDESNASVYIDGDVGPDDHWQWEPHWKNVEEYYKKYDHPLWKGFDPSKEDMHGGIDTLVLDAFFDALLNGKPMPIDVYDMATWMAITYLSEKSIAMGGAPVVFPDFTRGKYILRKNTFAV